ncbi:hypothetical protein [Streptomyces sp. CNQ431]|uniref:hypothetical protein n=1 Tax=Streptomyces sp. CNQ431 TaxID=1571532 RepID=UPI00053E9F34|nr:hypothetical protein [Streptomyces sp. CNQ431]
MARKRPGRVRTKNTNRRAPLLLSTMAPEDFNVRPGENMSIACPDCRTWRRIMGEKVLKVREHCISDKVADGEKHTSCPGSDQVVVVDIDVRRWQARQDRLLREAMPQDNRRATQQFYKPIPTPAPPVARIKAEDTLQSTRDAYFAHRDGCRKCVRSQHCQDGAALARRYVSAIQAEPARRAARKQRDRQEQRAARKQSTPAAREAQWAKHGPDAEQANNRCTERAPGAVSEYRGPVLPTLPPNPEAHDRRQTDLGRQYAARRPTAA